MLLDLGIRLRQFAIRIIELYESLPQSAVSCTIANQLLRCGTSVGAHYSEALYARSNAEFTAKVDLALQELAETAYWLDLLRDVAVTAESHLTTLRQETHELRAILVTVSKKAKSGGAYAQTKSGAKR